MQLCVNGVSQVTLTLSFTQVIWSTLSLLYLLIFFKMAKRQQQKQTTQNIMPAFEVELKLGVSKQFDTHNFALSKICVRLTKNISSPIKHQ